MNERIRELWRQAVLNNTKTPMNFQDAADEFAELIVLECAGIAYEYDIPNDTGILPGQFIGNRMKRLLGVK